MRHTFIAVLLTSTAFSSPVWATVNAADYGLSESGDNTAALQAAFNAAAPGEDVVIPSGRFAYSSQLRIDSARVNRINEMNSAIAIPKRRPDSGA